MEVRTELQLDFDPELNYTCVQCGRSCTGWNVWLNEQTADKLQNHPLTLRVIQERGQAFVREENGIKMYRQSTEQPCGFLRADKLCGVHAELGYEAKPLGCRQFPLFFTKLPDGSTRVSASFACKAVRERLGPPLQEQFESAVGLLGAGAVCQEAHSVVEIAPECSGSWAAVRAFEKAFEQQLGAQGWETTLERAVTGLAMAVARGAEPVAALEMEAGASLQEALWLVQTVLTLGLLKPCLYDNDRELWRRIDAGFLGETELEIPEFRWKAPVEELNQWVQAGVAGRFDGELDRYRAALWYRKAHLTVAGLLPGLLMLWSARPLLELLCGLFAWKRQSQPEIVDYWAALDLVETSLVAHSGNGALVYRPMAHHLVLSAGS